MSAYYTNLSFLLITLIVLKNSNICFYIVNAGPNNNPPDPADPDPLPPALPLSNTPPRAVPQSNEPPPPTGEPSGPAPANSEGSAATSQHETRIPIRFVSLRCGIGGKWNPIAQICSPYTLSSKEKVESKEESLIPKAFPTEEQGKNKDVESKGEEIIVEDKINLQIITIVCGIGYRYIRKDKICLPSTNEGRKVAEHQRIH